MSNREDVNKILDAMEEAEDVLNNVDRQYFPKVTRVEVIDLTKSFEDGGGRAWTFWSEYDTADIKDPSVYTMLQDGGRTLKVFIGEKK